MTNRWEAVICADYAHINNDEGGAPEKMAGLKLLPVATTDAKLTPDDLAQFAPLIGDEHRAQPKVVSITQSTELGTVYIPSEVSALAKAAHDLGLLVHMDGARLSNAAATLGVPLRDFTTDAGVDVLSLGATKIGAMGAEAVVILNPELDSSIQFIRKTSMQLPSKMRFVSAQILALFESDLYLRNAVHANSLALKLYEAIADIEGITVSRPQANALFPVLPTEVTARLQEKFRFYVWNHQTGQVRWMTSWDSTESDIEEFAGAIKAEMER
jgi:threonine aldolase